MELISLFLEISLYLDVPALQVGILGDTFGKVFEFFGDIFSTFFNFLGGLFSSLVTFLGNVFSKLFGVIWDGIEWIGNLIKNLFQGLIDFLGILVDAIFGLIAGLLYLLYMIGVLAVKLFLVLFEAVKILWALIVGFSKTLVSLTYTPQVSSGNGYSEMIGKIVDIAEPLQINSIAYILLFILWFSTAIGSIKLISSIRVGGS